MVNSSSEPATLVMTVKELIGLSREDSAIQKMSSVLLSTPGSARSILGAEGGAREGIIIEITFGRLPTQCQLVLL